MLSLPKQVKSIKTILRNGNDILHLLVTQSQELKSIQEIIELLEPYNISKLDILRIFKYLNIIKYGKQIDEVII